ncbi:MAG TPA: hypothetical protein K8W04_14965 [Bacteroides reticulotermitis]|nr:hypothetical protein [Bacteroides reticulotermitis]
MEKQIKASKETGKSLSCERKEIIDIMQQLVNANNKLSQLSNLKEFGWLYGSCLSRIDEQISDICASLGNVVGSTIACDIWDGKEVKHDI